MLTNISSYYYLNVQIFVFILKLYESEISNSPFIPNPIEP